MHCVYKIMFLLVAPKKREYSVFFVKVPMRYRAVVCNWVDLKDTRFPAPQTYQIQSLSETIFYLLSSTEQCFHHIWFLPISISVIILELHLIIRSQWCCLLSRQCWSSLLHTEFLNSLFWKKQQPPSRAGGQNIIRKPNRSNLNKIRKLGILSVIGSESRQM